jgi:DNA polymerase-3 subunit epsilon
VDAQQIYHAKEPRNLEAACLFYLNEKHENAHSALDDVLATWRIINAQLSRYDDLPRDPDGINSTFNRCIDAEGKFEWIHHKAAFTFGKHRGHLLEDVAKTDSEYLTWIVDKGEFGKEVKQIVQKALKGEFPQKSKSFTAGSS